MVQAMAWDWYPNGGIKGESKTLASMQEAEEWLKYQPYLNHVAVPSERAPELFDFIQGKES